MTKAPTRYLSFKVKSQGSDEHGDVWAWSIHEGPAGRQVREGRVHGDREKGERAARAAIAVMGGIVRTADEDDA